MFPSSHFQPYHGIHTFTSSPDVQVLHQELKNDLLRMENDMERRMQEMQQVCQMPPHHLERGRRSILNRPPATPGGMLVSRRNDNFELSLDVDQFPPEALTVKTEGRKLVVLGKYDQQRETGNGELVHEYREWRREADLPDDVNPKDVLCSMSRDGQLHFRAPRLALPAAQQRFISVNRDIHIPIMMGSRWALH